MRNDKRKYPRHAITDESLFIGSLNSGKYAIVRNISITGLAFEHFAGAGDQIDWTSIEIFMNGRERLYLPKIKCRVIYNISELSENSTFSGSAIRVCGLQFAFLSDEQEKQLVKLLNSRATGPIPNSTFEKEQGAKRTKSNY